MNMNSVNILNGVLREKRGGEDGVIENIREVLVVKQHISQLNKHSIKIS